MTTTWNNLNLRLTDGLPDWWAKERLEIVENLTSAIAMFGLHLSYQAVRDSLGGNLHPDIRREIESAIQEFGDTVGDPYRKMKRLGGSTERIVTFLKEHEGWDVSIHIVTVEGIEGNVNISDVCFGETDDPDVRHESGFTIHTKGFLNAFHFGDNGIRDIQVRYGDDDDVIIVQYHTGTWIDITCIPVADACSQN